MLHRQQLDFAGMEAAGHADAHAVKTSELWELYRKFTLYYNGAMGTHRGTLSSSSKELSGRSGRNLYLLLCLSNR